MSKLKPGTKSCNGSESGVKKVTIYIILSKEKTTNSTMQRITGNKLITSVSFFTTNQIFNNIKLIEMK